MTVRPDRKADKKTTKETATENAMASGAEPAPQVLALRRSEPIDPVPLGAMIAGPEDLALVNPNAKWPFDPAEWATKWLGDLDDAAFYLEDEAGRPVGFFALRVGIGPEVRHLTYAYVTPEARGGAGPQMARLIEEAARALGALSVTLKCELDNAPALATYRAAGYEELSRRGGMATMRLDLN